MSGFSVQVRDLTVRYGSKAAVASASLEVEAGSITGLLGRNGSGKTTLLSTLAGLRPASSGTVLVDGEDPFENERVMAGTCIVRESGDVLADESLTTNLEFLTHARPSFDEEYARTLLDAFELSPEQRPGGLSRGQRSAFGAVVGLASRAPLTIYDEVYLGMDAPSRYRFYDLLLADYVEHPRTVILSSHLIGEMERFLEHVVILHAGGVLLTEATDELRSSGLTVTGPAPTLDVQLAGLPVIAERSLGGTKQATLYGRIGADVVERLEAAGLELGPVGVQDLFVHLTDKELR